MAFKADKFADSIMAEEVSSLDSCGNLRSDHQADCDYLQLLL